MIVSASLDALYGSTIVSLRAESAETFRVAVTGTVLRTSIGRIAAAQECASEEQGPGRHVVELEVLDWIVERAVGDEAAQGPENRYGISFYPFVSSYLRGKIVIAGVGEPSLQFLVDVPDTFRLLYAQANVQFDGRRAAEPRHTQGTERSRFIFADGAAATIDCDVAVRFSAAHLAELVTYPTAYYLLSLAGIGVAALASRLSIAVTALGALWTFMLREWSKAGVPRRQTLLSAAYVMAAVAAGGWTALWEGVGVWAALAIPLVAVMAGGLTAARRRFDRTGSLPAAVARGWRWRVGRRS